MTTTQNMYKDKRSASERLASLESTIPAIVNAIGKQIDPINQNIQQLVTAINELRVYTDAVVGMLGAEAVAVKVAEVKTEQANQQMAEEDADTERRVKAGELVPTETSADGSILVVSSFGPDGKAQVPAHRRMAVAQVKEELRPQFVGKKVGDFVTLEDGSRIEILQVFSIDQQAIVARAQAESSVAAQ